jgi:NTP pyrophosphatase (non-canonical NTP hydrolase)
MTINEMVKCVHENAKDHGWHDGKRTPTELLCLIHSEVSEVLEEIRMGEPLDKNRIVSGKPEGVPSELADIVIRVADMCGLYGIDLDAAIVEKMAYNKTRPFRHGGKTL